MGLHDVVKASYLGLKEVRSDNKLLDYWWFLEQEVNSWKHWVDLPLRRRLWMWRHGFPSPYGKLYDLDSHDPDAFLSELQRYRLYKSLNGEHRYLIDDKLSQHWMLSDYPSNRPTAYGLVDRGRLHSTGDTAYDGDPRPVAEVLPSMIRDHGTLVLKQLRGKAGKEVLICEYDGEYRLDGEDVSEETLVDELAELSHYLVTEYVEQHDYANELYPHSPNTIRVLTLWDNELGELHTPFAAQRIGTDQSRPIDNFSAGGIAAEIDVETGELGSAVQFPFSGDVSWYDTHPDTGAQLKGATVPDWESILETVEEIALANTDIPAIGWDVIVDGSGEPVIIEANTGTDFDMVQVHRPLLEDQRVARIAARHLPEVEGPSEASTAGSVSSSESS